MQMLAETLFGMMRPYQVREPTTDWKIRRNIQFLSAWVVEICFCDNALSSPRHWHLAEGAETDSTALIADSVLSTHERGRIDQSLRLLRGSFVVCWLV